MNISKTPAGNSRPLIYLQSFFLLLFAIAQFSSLPIHAQNCFAPPSGLVSWWPAEGNASDVAGTNAGTPISTPTFAAGEVGQAFRFNGTNQYVMLSNSPSLNPAGSFSIEAWINYSKTNAGNGTIMGKWGGTGDYDNQRSYVFQVLPGGALAFAIADAAHQLDTSFHTFTTTNNAIALNTWTHVAAVYDQSTGTRRIFVNGVNVANRTNAPITILNATANAGIGSYLLASTQPVDFFGGLLDEVSFYNRALTAAEITSIYGAGAGGKCHPASAPVIVTQPTSQSVLVGANVTFTVVANGAAPLNYQWQVGLANLPGATNSSLTLANVQSSQAGVYSVVVYNAIGTATSSNATLTVTPVVNCVPPPSGLVSWWTAEGNATDLLGANPGALVNGPTFVAGEVGQAFHFNGTNQYVMLSNSPSLNPAGSFSIEAWINYSGANPAWNVIMGKWGGSGDYDNMRSYVFDVAADRSLAFGITDQAHQLDTAFQTFLTPSNVVPLNVWTHVAAVYDQSTGTRKIFVNGVLVASQTDAPLTVLNTTANGGIGGVLDNSTTPLNLFGGLLDEVSFYNRALTGAEIASIYGAGSAGKCQSLIAASIVTPPASQTVAAGANVTFNVVAAGSAPLGYQWRLNGTNLVGATGSSLTLSNVQTASAGNYSVVVSNSINSVTSANALLTVTPVNSCVPPPSGLVSWWPAQTNANDVVGGNSGTLINSPAFAAGEVGFAFRFNATNQYVKLSNSPSLNPSGSFTIEAWINNSKTNGGNGTIMGKWGGTGDYDNLRSYVFQVLPGGALSFAIADAAHQQDTSFHAFTTTNNAIALNSWTHVAAVYDQSTGTRRIFVNGVNVANRTDAPITILNASANGGIGSYLLASAQPVDFFGGLLDEVSFYNRALTGPEIASIYGAGSAGKCQSLIAASIVTPPASQTVAAGANVTFNVVAAGSAPLGYQWRFNGTNLSGATNSSLTLTNVQLASSGNYSVVVSNSVNSVTSANALLTVTPVITCFPPPSGLVSWWTAEGNANDLVGTNAGILVNSPIFATGEVGQSFHFDGTSQFVKLSNSPSLNPAGSFTIEAWINYSGISSSGHGTIMGKWGGSGDYNNQRSYIFQILPTGALVFGISDAAHQLDTAFQTLATTSNAVVLNTWTHVAAEYDQSAGTRRIFVNGVNVASRNDMPITVLNAAANAGIGAYLLSSTAPADFFGGLLDEVSFYNRALTGAEIASIYGAGSAGKCQSLIAASIVTQPSSQTVLVGANATFSVGATGSAPLGYQWRLNGTNLSGATGSSLTLSNVQPASAGNYSVVVSNSVNSVTSANALLTVTPINHPPVANNQTASVPVNTLVAILLSGSDADGNTITYSVVTQPAHGNLSGTAPNLLYQPATNYIGPDAFTFKVNDGMVDSTIATVTLNVQSNLTAISSLIDVDVGFGTNTAEVGFAAAGLSSGDYWNLSTRDIAGAAVPNLKFTDGTSSGAGMTVSNFTGAWFNNTSDPMYFSYLYSQIGSITITVNNLPAGQYDIYLYGHGDSDSQNSSFSVNVGATGYGNKSTTSTAAWNSVVWQEGIQYVVFRGVTISNLAQPTTLTVSPGASGYAVIAGIQFAKTIGSTIVAPVITNQPASQTVLTGANVNFNVGVSGTSPFLYQWRLNGTNIIGATNASLALNNVQPSQAGNYSVVVANTAGSATSANAALAVNVPSSALQVVSVTTTSAVVTVPINLISQGNENALGFSINFDHSLLTFTGASLGSGDAGASLLVNSNLMAGGQLGVALSLPSNTSFSPGTRQVALISFAVAPVSVATVSSITFGDQPVLRQVSDVHAVALTATYTNGTVTVPFGFEGDVSPRPGGNAAVTIIDWVQVGRFVAGLDTIASPAEFQKADCAPRSTLGDGLLTVADWVQAGRYAAGLDPLTLAGGPTGAPGGVPGPNSLAHVKSGLGSSDRTIAITSAKVLAGQPCEISVQLNSLGNENALGFSFTFDSSALSFTGATLGSGAGGSTLNINTDQAASGTVGMALALPIGSMFTADMQQVVKLNFMVANSAKGILPISFASAPVVQDVADADAASLVASYIDGTLDISGVQQTTNPVLTIMPGANGITLSWPSSASGYNLESSGDLNSTNWTTVVTAPVTNGSDITVAVPVSGSQQFYRLRQP